MVSNSEPLTEGTVIMADNQFAGRGQHNNVWYAQPGLNLTFSLYLKPVFLPVNQQFLLNMAISIGIRDALKSLIPEGICVKWPNDIYYKNLKVGGVLIENMISGSTYKTAIIGIGINVNQQRFDFETAKKAGSLKEILQQDVNLLMLLAEICRQIEKQYLRLKSGDDRLLRQDYTNSLYRFGELAAYRHNDTVFNAKLIDVSEAGQLVLLRGAAKQYYNFKEIEFLNNNT